MNRSCWEKAVVLVLGLLAPVGGAVDVSSMAGVVVMDESRKKPIDTYARTTLLRFSGRRSVEGTPALAWLAEVLFDERAAAQRRVFLIDNPDVVDALGIPRQRRRYSFADIRPGLALLSQWAEQVKRMAPAERSPHEGELLRLHENVSEYMRLSTGLGFLDLHPRSGFGNPLPRIIPDSSASGERWYSPWDYVAARGSAALRSGPLVGLAAMREAYREGDQRAFDSAAQAFALAVSGTAGVAVPPTALEVRYNRLDPVARARLALAAALLAALLFVFRPNRLVRWTGLGLAGVGLVLLSAAMVLRMAIMHRPPVVNLYETFVFVACACAALGLALEYVQRSGVGLLVASAGGFAFVHIAGRFSLDGDTMGMLAPVLNSSFWLATHITTISLGYAGCAAAAGVAHVYLVKRCAGLSEEAARGTDAAACAMLLFGLTFTVIGTVLGGLWADQAWGRFWGWDPKENGALLIILWCAAVLHARRGGLIGPAGTAIGSVALFVLMMLAWLGANLLGVGMHAYGFTTGGARTLFAIAATELLLAAVTGALLLRKRGARHGLSAR